MSPSLVLRSLCLVLIATVLSALPASPASAQVRRVSDSLGDAPASVDLRRVDYYSNRGTLKIAMSVPRLQRKPGMVFSATFRVPGDTVEAISVEAVVKRDGTLRRKFYYSRYISFPYDYVKRHIRCPQQTSTVSPRRHRATLTIPVSCLRQQQHLDLPPRPEVLVVSITSDPTKFDSGKTIRLRVGR